MRRSWPLLWPLLAWLAGCTADGPETLLADYLARINHSLEEQAEPADPGRLPPYPRPRLRRLPLEEYRVGLLDFLDLDRCGLQQLVAQRNSGLGRVMPPSHLLAYEHRFLVQARACAATADTAWATQMGQIVALKERNLPRVWWNATFGADEMAGLFAGQATALTLDASADPSSSTDALRYLAALGPRLGQPDLDLDPAVLEPHLQQLAAHRHGSRLLYSVDLLTRYLDATALALERRQARQAVCLNGQPTPRARTLHKVFTKYYAGRVQPYMASIHRQAHAFATALGQLAQAQQSAIPAAFAAYRPILGLTGDTPWSRLDRAIARHTRAWQLLLDQCGMAPGKFTGAATTDPSAPGPNR